MREQFLLRNDLAFLNHGSFGACPKPVFAVYQNWQRELEAQPVEFLGGRVPKLLAEARAPLAAYLGADRDDIVFVPNATHGVNIVARSLELRPGDEILTTDHEYGACDRVWRFLCGQSGARYIPAAIPLPITSQDEIVERLLAAITPRTKMIYLSHISSPTAITLPVAAICHAARERGILTLIDGAHAPGQIDLNMAAIGADFYTGNCHKWLLAPKGSAFLYARREAQPLLKPLVVSWGYEPRAPGVSPFQDLFGWTGTMDPAAYLTVPAALDFMSSEPWQQALVQARQQALSAHERLVTLTGAAPVCPSGAPWWTQLFVVELPECDVVAVKDALYEEFQVEVPLIAWGGRQFVRVSVQGYTQPAELSRLEQGATLDPQSRRFCIKYQPC